MDQTIDKDLTIMSLTAVPRTKNFYNFYINGTPEKRSMKPEKLADLIDGICPAVGGAARKMIYELRPFYVEVETDSIMELVENPGKPKTRKELAFGTKKSVLENPDKPNQYGVDKGKNRIFQSILNLAK